MQKILDLEVRFSLKKQDNYLVENLKSSYNESEKNFINLSKKIVSILKNSYFSIIFNKKKPCCKRFFEFLKRIFFGPSIAKLSRQIFLNGTVIPENYFKNVVKNQKYTIITFVPLVLFNQFKYFYNFFFLLIALSQLYEPLRVGVLLTYLIPLVFVVLMAIIKEASDEYKRYKKDKEANSKTYNVLTSKGFKEIKSSDLKVGDIIEIKAKERVPADLILLYSNYYSGTAFIQTHQLDGETDWKLRESVSFTQKYITENPEIDIIEMRKIPCSFKVMEPSEKIDYFEGCFKRKDKKYKENLFLQNTIWANCILASGSILGLVIYTGKESRMQINSEHPRSKISKLENELNLLSKFIFLFIFFISLIMVCLSGVSFRSITPLMQLLRYILLMSSIIPISLRVNMDFAKIIYTLKIAKDSEIKDTVVRNSAIPEDLGRIQYLLTDKTGTLTKNEMIFKKLSLEQIQFTHEKRGEIAKFLKKNCEKGLGPLLDMNPPIRGGAHKKKTATNEPRRKLRREKENMVRDLITAMVICHNVTPYYDNDKKDFHASSPDEIALVKIAEKLGMELLMRDHFHIKIKNAKGFEENYKILANFPFTSENKKMGIIVKHEESEKIIFYLKGADMVMKQTVPEIQRGFLLDECENLAREGLRTLVLTQKFMQHEEFDYWEKKYKDAQMTINDRAEKIKNVMNSLESNMEFLGITGVEDRLQEDVYQTLENIRNAGIQIWMLTGDKAETAICTAISAGIKENNKEVYIMKEIEDEMIFQDRLNQFHNLQNHILAIDSITLMTAIQRRPRLFFSVASGAPAVICFFYKRCTPKQKALVVEGIKQYCKGQVAAIGDGVNDVGMIQKSDVGIGIFGKEGQQAALAADFSIQHYKFLDDLLLWHGRLSYKRSALLSQFVIHRGLIISVMQAIFTGIFYFVAIPLYNGMLMMGYSTIYTMLPVFSLIFNEDVDRATAIKYPPLYKSLQKGRDMNVKTFLLWIWKSLYQGGIILLVSLSLFDSVFLNIVLITFSSLILTEFLNVYSELNSFHFVMLISQILSLFLYFYTIMLLNNVFDLSYLTWAFLWKIIVITLMSWLPLHLLKLLIRRIDPTDYEKIMSGVHLKKKKKKIDQMELI